MSEPPDDSSAILNRTIILPARYTSLSTVRNFVGQIAQQCGLGALGIYQVQLAADEAFTNIIEHAYGGECMESVLCSCVGTRQGLEISMRDCGQAFNPDQVPQPDFSTSLEERQSGGLGLYLMRQIMDEVDFCLAPDPLTGQPCNLLRMFKRIEVTS